MPKFRVWFDQVNETMFDVKAKDEDAAIEKARRAWKKENGEPFGASVQEIMEKDNADDN